MADFWVVASSSLVEVYLRVRDDHSDHRGGKDL